MNSSTSDLDILSFFRFFSFFFLFSAAFCITRSAKVGSESLLGGPSIEACPLPFIFSLVRSGGAHEGSKAPRLSSTLYPMSSNSRSVKALS